MNERERCERCGRSFDGPRGLAIHQAKCPVLPAAAKRAGNGRKPLQGTREADSQRDEAEGWARERFPDAAELSTTLYQGDVIVSVWREWPADDGEPSGYYARQFLAMGQVI